MIRTYSVRLEGMTPLLMHWDNIEWADYMEAWRANPANQGASKAGDDRTPAFRWVGYVYNDGKHVCIPQENLARCLMEGGAMVPTGKGKKTFKAQTQSGMKIDRLFVALENNGAAIPWEPIRELQDVREFPSHLQAVERMGFSLSTKRVRVGQSKHIRVRPQFDDWALEFELSVWDDALTKEVLQSIFEYAGQYKGLCEWRPGGKTPGPFGMFRLASLAAA